MDTLDSVVGGIMDTLDSVVGGIMDTLDSVVDSIQVGKVTDESESVKRRSTTNVQYRRAALSFTRSSFADRHHS
jgi:hypothetical protein